MAPVFIRTRIDFAIIAERYATGLKYCTVHGLTGRFAIRLWLFTGVASFLIRDQQICFGRVYGSAKKESQEICARDNFEHVSEALSPVLLEANLDSFWKAVFDTFRRRFGKIWKHIGLRLFQDRFGSCVELVRQNQVLAIGDLVTELVAAFMRSVGDRFCCTSP
jgi:hypothetical protein